MDSIQERIIETYGNRIRIRVCGICVQDRQILLVKHLSLGPKGVFWAPPGGGLEFGETAEESLAREFREETGLEIEVSDFLFVHEFLHPPLHAVELFFETRIKSGTPIRGMDPEMSPNEQILQEVRFFSMDEIKESDADTFHNILRLSPDVDGLKKLRGYYSYIPLDRK